MDKLKIDKFFVIDVVDDLDDAAIAQIINNLTKQLNRDGISKGMETISQFEFLLENDCNVIQGYHFSLLSI